MSNQLLLLPAPRHLTFSDGELSLSTGKLLAITNRPGGLQDSVARLEKMQSDYAAG